jgi:hypothetical protein
MSWGISYAALHDQALAEFDKQAGAVLKGQPNHEQLFAGLRTTLEAYLGEMKGSAWNNGVLVTTSGHVGGDYGTVQLDVKPVRIVLGA